MQTGTRHAWPGTSLSTSARRGGIPESAEDVAAVVAFARAEGLRVAPQGTGHNAGTLGDLADTILLKTHRMRGVTIDPDTRTARAEAGVIWIEVVEAAAEHGLAALAAHPRTSASSVLARRRPLLARPEARHRRESGDGDRGRHRVRRPRPNGLGERADLFWALRGGGGSFAIVTAIEFNLFR